MLSNNNMLRNQLSETVQYSSRDYHSQYFSAAHSSSKDTLQRDNSRPFIQQNLQTLSQADRHRQSPTGRSPTSHFNKAEIIHENLKQLENQRESNKRLLTDMNWSLENPDPIKGKLPELRKQTDPVGSYFEGLAKFTSERFSPSRLAKTNVKSASHNPITGTFTQYNRGGSPHRALGSGQPEHFPGKIFDSSPSANNYKLPEYAKKIPRSTAFNPLIHETVDYNRLDYATYGSALATYNEAQNYTVNRPEVIKRNEIPIYKGMGYRRSNIFD